MRDKLTESQVRTSKPGWKGDGAGLWLLTEGAKADVRRRWVFRFVSPETHKPRKFGLGVFPTITLKHARQKAQDVRLRLDAGTDPVAARRADKATWVSTAATQQAIPLFRAVALEWLDKQNWRWADRAHHERNRLERHVFPILGSRKVSTIDLDAVMTVLDPLKETSGEIRNVRRLLETIIDYYRAFHSDLPDNPAQWVRVKPRLGVQAHVVQHAPTLPWREAPALWQRLQATQDTDRMTRTAAMVRFLMLTGARGKEAREATWSQIRGDAWTVPQGKNGQEWSQPLSTEALTLLTAQPKNNNYIFTTERGLPMPTAYQSSLMKTLGVADEQATHGLRSMMTDWVRETQPDVSQELLDALLGHKERSGTRRAYQRVQLVELKRVILEKWARYLTSKGN